MLSNCDFEGYFEREADSPKLLESLEKPEQRKDSLEPGLVFAKQVLSVALSREARYVSAIVNHTFRTWDSSAEAEIRRQPLDSNSYAIAALGSVGARVTEGNRIMDFSPDPGSESRTVVAKNTPWW